MFVLNYKLREKLIQIREVSLYLRNCFAFRVYAILSRILAKFSFITIFPIKFVIGKLLIAMKYTDIYRFSLYLFPQFRENYYLRSTSAT